MRYKYDDAGERVIKRGPQGETAYVNQFFTMRNREVGTKHVFAGGTRLVSKLVKQPKDTNGDGTPDPIANCSSQPWGWTNGNGQGGGRGNGQGPANGWCHGGGNGGGGANGPGPTLYEKDQYYFHPDHLGSSSYVTDADGEIFQHLEYFPFGETWVEESSNTQRTPYLFTGKELDEETDLYYFGARYYDPRTSVWQSPDPILADYMGGAPAGGVYAPPNLNLYSYSYQRPVNMVDPNGESPIWDWFMTQSESDRENTWHAMRHYAMAETISEGIMEGGHGYDPDLLEQYYNDHLAMGDFFLARVGQGVKSRIFWDSLQAAEILGTLAGGRLSIIKNGSPAALTTAQMARATRASAHVVLRANMIAAGQVARLGAGSPHHLVAWGHELAAPARRVLQRFGIGINSAENGAFLPWTSAQARKVGGVAHATLGNNHGYMRWVNRLLGACNTRDCVVSTLNNIGKALQDGRTPWLD